MMALKKGIWCKKKSGPLFKFYFLMIIIKKSSLVQRKLKIYFYCPNTVVIFKKRVINQLIESDDFCPKFPFSSHNRSLFLRNF